MTPNRVGRVSRSRSPLLVARPPHCKARCSPPFSSLYAFLLPQSQSRQKFPAPGLIFFKQGARAKFEGRRKRERPGSRSVTREKMVSCAPSVRIPSSLVEERGQMRGTLISSLGDRNLAPWHCREDNHLAANGPLPSLPRRYILWVSPGVRGGLARLWASSPRRDRRGGDRDFFPRPRSPV